MISVRLENIFDEELIKRLLAYYAGRKTVCGRDGVYPSELGYFWELHGDTIKKLILSERYTPIPAEKVLIPKPGSRKKRELLIPCVVDGMIMKAINSLISPYYDKTFSDSSFGFRFGRGCHHALKHVLEIMNQGYDYTISIDLASYFDTVNHNILFQILNPDFEDKRLVRLIETYVTTRVIAGRHTYRKHVGVPQGSALSPLLANIYLNEFDQEMDRMEYRFVRYADDIVIFARNESEKDHIFEYVCNFLINNLKLTINIEKTVIDRERLNYLGYELRKNEEGEYCFYICEKKKTKVYEKMDLNMGRQSRSELQWLDRLGAFNRGWLNYYAYSEYNDTAALAEKADEYQKKCITQKVSISESNGFITMSKWWDLLNRQKEGS